MTFRAVGVQCDRTRVASSSRADQKRRPILALHALHRDGSWQRVGSCFSKPAFFSAVWSSGLESATNTPFQKVITMSVYFLVVVFEVIQNFVGLNHGIVPC